MQTVEFIVTDVCIFCLRHRGDIPDPGAQTCTYSLGHEFPPRARPKQASKVDASLCARCGLHPKNPAGMTNGCAHTYPGSVEAYSEAAGRMAGETLREIFDDAGLPPVKSP